MCENDSGIATLETVLRAKEERAAVQAELRSRYDATVVSVSVIMPGNRKVSRDTLDLIGYAVSRLRILLARERIFPAEERNLQAVGGPSTVFSTPGCAERIKRIAMLIEQETSFGRLLDIDVFDKSGRQLSRSSAGMEGRACFVCSGPAILCIRGRRHNAQEVAEAVERLLRIFRETRQK